jgi:hypothetical protein
MALGLIQPLTELTVYQESYGGEGGVMGGWPARKADDLTAIRETTV